MSSLRRAVVVVLAVALLGAVALFRSASADQPAPVKVAEAKTRKQVAQFQPAPAPNPPPFPGNVDEPVPDPAFTEGLTLPTERKDNRCISLAKDLIEGGNWGEASTALQSLLNSNEDHFLEIRTKDTNSKPTIQWTSTRSEANRLLGTFPPEGREVYEIQFGHKAKDLLGQAKAKSDPQLLAEVAQKYLHTDAGAEAANLLGTYYLDRGDYVDATLCFERLLSQPSADKLSPLTLFKAALAFRRHGDLGEVEKTWKRLAKASPEGLRLGDRTVSLDQLQQELDRVGSVQVASLYDWPMVRGNASRSAEGNGGAPYLDDVLWSTDTTQPFDPLRPTQTQQWIAQVLDSQERKGLPILPAFSPIAATVQGPKGPLPLLVYRSYGGVHAVDIRTGDLFWKSPSDLSLDNLLADPQKQATLNQWLAFYNQAGSQSILYENSTLGTLSTDNTLVYLVDDLALPPHPAFLGQFQWGPQPSFGTLQEAVYHNTLKAYELETGKFHWMVGGGVGKEEKDKDANPLADSYFLGPPLPLGGKLYVLNEKKSELRLLCLDPLKKGALAWTQTLANARDALVQDVGRRVQAANLAYGEGVLVCPTNAGAVLGVDLLSHSLLWAYSYRQGTPSTGPGGMRQPAVYAGQQIDPSGWKDSAPVVQDGKVVFTAFDGNAVHCLNLRNGTPLWTVPRAEDLYLAGVYNGKVLLVGKSRLRALSLADGKPLWTLDNLGLPSGQGVASKGVYYLPLRAGKDKEPEVCAIDIDRGLVQGHSHSRKRSDGKMEVPGNLLFYEGDVLSQTATAVTAYPQLDVKLAQIDERLKTNAGDPTGLTERGEMRLDKGDFTGAVADLRTALENHPPADVLPKTRAKLFETLTELFQRDFDANEKFLEEYKELCKINIPADAEPEKRGKLEEEQQRRQANFLCLLAKGREKQGRLLEAFDAYTSFGVLNGNKDLVSVVDEPAVKARPDVWAQGRIAAMIARATPEQRQPLEGRIDREWEAVRMTSDIEALRHFVAVFGSLFTVGKEARLQLAERLMEEKGYLEAELNLDRLRREDDPQLAARAVEALARLTIRRGLMEDAAYYYRILGSQFAGVVIRDGKTGADFWNDLATDKRFLPYLDEPREGWGKGKIKSKEISGTFNQMQQTFVFEPEGELLPFFENHRLALVNSQALKLIDRSTNEDHLLLNLTTNGGQFQQYLNNGYQNIRFPYHMKGHLVILNIGPMVYALDPVEQKPLWQMNLLGVGPTQPSQYMPDPAGGLQAVYPDGFVQKLGRTGPIESSYVCLQTRQGLVVLDPLTGDKLWTKADVSMNTQIFGDEQHLYLLEVRDNGTIGVGKALRAHDGVAEDVPDFASLFQRRIRILGRDLLVSDTSPQGNRVLRLYDVQTGKDLWSREFSPKSRVIHTEEEGLTGVVEPDNGGKVTVIDLRTRKEVLVTRMNPKELDNVQDNGVQGVYLLEDNDLFYVVINGPPDPKVNPWGGPWSNLGPGMRSLMVNGKVYAFWRPTGKLNWIADVPSQMIVLEQFKDLPMILFTGRLNRPINPAVPNNGAIQVAGTKCIEKRTGKLVYDKEIPNGNQFYGLNVDGRSKSVELVSYNLKIQLYLEATAAKAGENDGKPSLKEEGTSTQVGQTRAATN